MHLSNPLLRIRPETPHDSDFLARLHRSTRDDLLQAGLPDRVLEQLLAMQCRAQQSSYRQRFPNAEFSIIEQDGAAIGQLVVHRGDMSIRLIYMALLPRARRRGYGRCLLQALQAEAALKRKPVTLSVSKQNIAAQRLYASLGWSATSQDDANLEMIWLKPETPAAG
ncbi:GNAT family N-acetyltransferase [Methylomonas rivi]|uniref:GNAT family N-acetyltransferase n=1 Tax=Methylomonas rivi TaxID=2952226 RepID=A0ABT1U6Q9_9GAMM|nr:GNAT family N-acetyltransferase [Methylomonas sp. WSC-6]MCQ8129548.1 GNAT family N-acetyltransferase [Methylomonas sp. WSC-6]